MILRDAHMIHDNMGMYTCTCVNTVVCYDMYSLCTCSSSDASLKGEEPTPKFVHVHVVPLHLSALAIQCPFHSLLYINRVSEAELNWAKHLTLPSRFSKQTKMAIESRVLTRKAHVEIHNSVATLMLVYTS